MTKKIIRNMIISCLLIMVGIIANPNFASADRDGNECSVGIETVGNYSAWSDLNDLSSPADIGNDIEKAFKKAKAWKIGYVRKNNGVGVSNFKGASLGGNDGDYADNVDLLFYSGHSLKPKKHGASDYSFALNTYGKKHYAKQGEMRLGNKDLEWFVTFSCNFLNGDMKKVGRLAKGLHAVCGFKTDMTLTKDAGSVFCNKLKAGISVKEAYFAYAKATQAKRNKNVAAVFTTKKCASDRIWGYGSVAKDPKSYSEDPSSYVMYYYNCY